MGRRARARLGGALVAGRARHACAVRAPVRRRLRRVLASARVDGPAAPPQGAGHLLPPQAPRRQAALQQRPATLLRLRDARRSALPAADAAADAARAAVGPGGARRLHLLAARALPARAPSLHRGRDPASVPGPSDPVTGRPPPLAT